MSVGRLPGMGLTKDEVNRWRCMYDTATQRHTHPTRAERRHGTGAHRAPFRLGLLVRTYR